MSGSSGQQDHAYQPPDQDNAYGPPLQGVYERKSLDRLKDANQTPPAKDED